MEFLREAAVVTAPDETFARERTTRRRASVRQQRRELVEDFSDGEEDGGYTVGRRRTGLRLTFSGGIPRGLWGRLAASAALLAIIGVLWAATEMARRMIMHDERFVLASASSVVTQGNDHVSRPQLLGVFGGDIERNILHVSLDERKAELEQIPWVKHATVMRLLPDRLSVAIEERTPIAFTRQGGHIGLVDGGGVLLGMTSEGAGDAGYSFPIVTGIGPGDPVSVRAARMKIFQEFTKDLDARGEKISAKLSEVDLSNPEDIRALIPDQGADVLVHFGDRDYLDRYKKYEAHLAEWRSQYPKLSSVDMRYERQVVLEMQAGSAVPLAGIVPAIADPVKPTERHAAADKRTSAKKAQTEVKGAPSHSGDRHSPSAVLPRRGAVRSGLKAGRP